MKNENQKIFLFFLKNILTKLNLFDILYLPNNKGELIMIYYSNSARDIAINNISRLTKIIMEQKTSNLSFVDALDICYYLQTLKDELEKEKKR